MKNWQQTQLLDTHGGALDLFDKQYIHVGSKYRVETSPLDKKYQAPWKIRSIHWIRIALKAPKKDLLVHLQEAKLSTG